MNAHDWSRLVVLLGFASQDREDHISVAHLRTNYPASSVHCPKAS